MHNAAAGPLAMATPCWSTSVPERRPRERCCVGHPRGPQVCWLETLFEIVTCRLIVRRGRAAGARWLDGAGQVAVAISVAYRGSLGSPSVVCVCVLSHRCWHIGRVEVAAVAPPLRGPPLVKYTVGRSSLPSPMLTSRKFGSVLWFEAAVRATNASRALARRGAGGDDCCPPSRACSMDTRGPAPLADGHGACTPCRCYGQTMPHEGDLPLRNAAPELLATNALRC